MATGEMKRRQGGRPAPQNEEVAGLETCTTGWKPAATAGGADRQANHGNRRGGALPGGRGSAAGRGVLGCGSRQVGTKS